MSAPAIDDLGGRTAEQHRRVAYAAAAARYEGCLAAAAHCREQAAIQQWAADEMAPWKETIAQLFLAADQMDGSLRHVGVKDYETFADVAGIQEKALTLAQATCLAHGRCLQRVDHWLALAAAADTEAGEAYAEMARFS